MLESPYQLRKRWWSGKIECADGWQVSFGSSIGSRLDSVLYKDGSKQMSFSCEGGVGVIDFLAPFPKQWDGDKFDSMQDAQRCEILDRVFAACRFSGLDPNIWEGKS